MTQDKFVQARRKKEAYRGTSTDDNADCADLDKSNAQVINGQFLTSVGDRTFTSRRKKNIITVSDTINNNFCAFS